ncbi:MAG: hypothetical protein ACHREM_11500 [Polyangiales bacterium]
MPTGKKANKQRKFAGGATCGAGTPFGGMPRIAAGALSEEQTDLIIDGAVAAVHYTIPEARACLYQADLLRRLLAVSLPGSSFEMKLGAVNLHPRRADIEVITFDPRPTGNLDDGFHAWLENREGILLDCSMPISLHDEGYRIRRDEYFSHRDRTVPFEDFVLVYEELPELELVCPPEAERMMQQMVLAAADVAPKPPGMITMDVRWKPGREPKS